MSEVDECQLDEDARAQFRAWLDRPAPTPQLVCLVHGTARCAHDIVVTPCCDGRRYVSTKVEGGYVMQRCPSCAT